MSDHANEATPDVAAKPSLKARILGLFKRKPKEDGHAEPAEHGHSATHDTPDADGDSERSPSFLEKNIVAIAAGGGLILVIIAFVGGIGLGRLKSQLEAKGLQNQIHTLTTTLNTTREELKELKTEHELQTTSLKMRAEELQQSQDKVHELENELKTLQEKLGEAKPEEPAKPTDSLLPPGGKPAAVYSRNQNCVLSGDLKSVRAGIKSCISPANKEATAPQPTHELPSKPVKKEGH